MGKVTTSVRVGVRASTAEALWYDTARWPSFVDGLKHVVRVDDGWPGAGARVLWDSYPGGRGRVSERVQSYEARTGQTSAVEDEQVRGTQTVSFTPLEDGAAVTLALDYEVKESRPGMWLVDLVFVRRAQKESLARTLRRFAVELAAEPEPSR